MSHGWAGEPGGTSDARAAWSANAAFWDARMGEGNDWVERLCWPAIVRLAAPAGGERWLDVACGNGLIARRLAALGAAVVAFDLAPEMIEHARARARAGESIEYRVIDAGDETALGALGAGRFDGAVSNMALMDMPAIAPLCRALATLLRPGGRFVATVMHPAFNQDRASLVRAAAAPEGGAAGSGVLVTAYRRARVDRGVAIVGQPVPQPYFHRALADLLTPAFDAGLVLDGIEEPAFDDRARGAGTAGTVGTVGGAGGADGAGRGADARPTWRDAPEIPPVLAVRLRRP